MITEITKIFWRHYYLQNGKLTLLGAVEPDRMKTEMYNLN